MELGRIAHVTGASAAIQPPWRLLIQSVQGLTILFVCAYLLQIATPFRLNTDSIRLHYMAIGFQEGIGLYGYGERLFPPVFPLFLVGLESCGLANGHMFVVVNVIALVVGWVFTWQLLGEEHRLAPSWRWLVLFVTLASWVCVKHVTLALTDIPYFAVAAAALLGIQRLSHDGLPHFAIRAASVAVVIALAIGIRTHGIALLPAFVFVLGRRLFASVDRLGHQRRVVVVLAACGLLAVATGLCLSRFGASGYARFSLLASTDGFAARMMNTLAMRAGNCVELAANLPLSKVPSAVRPWFTVAGSLGIVCFAALFVQGWRNWRASDLYLAAYLGILAVWPFSDARFLLPVMPLMWSTVLCGVRPKSAAGFLAVGAVVAWFAITGALALGYSTRISFAGADFPDAYSPTLLNTYRAAYGQEEISSAPPADPAIRRLIRRYQFGDVGPASVSAPDVQDGMPPSPAVSPSLP